LDSWYRSLSRAFSQGWSHQPSTIKLDKGSTQDCKVIPIRYNVQSIVQSPNYIPLYLWFIYLWVHLVIPMGIYPELAVSSSWVRC
uniref:Ovule protein n=1 Tax=Haemonchus placei TaxID=6290 RepID=A0A0N4WHT1_HAEPC